jgi:phosphoribosylformylglycinamidine synthase subunit PurQ / glutaminase
MKSRVNALVLTGYGLNCDIETAHACELAGARADRVHLNDVISGAANLADYQLLVFIGGFSWGDDHGAGVVQAVRMKKNAGDRIVEFVENGNLVLGICNGFQTIVNMGLLPGFDNDYQARVAALAHNDCGNFRDDWVHLSIDPESPCVFTRSMTHIELPVRHGEGKVVASENVISRLKKNRQIVCRYSMPDGTPANGHFPENPNGSMDDIAGICDPTGRIFGLMPHPEAFNHPTNHPNWTRSKALSRKTDIKQPTPPTLGLQIFKNAVEYISG